MNMLILVHIFSCSGVFNCSLSRNRGGNFIIAAQIQWLCDQGQQGMEKKESNNMKTMKKNKNSKSLAETTKNNPTLHID